MYIDKDDVTNSINNDAIIQRFHNMKTRKRKF